MVGRVLKYPTDGTPQPLSVRVFSLTTIFDLADFFLVYLVVPRQNTEDDVYRGMFIPKGSTILVNPTYVCRSPLIDFFLTDVSKSTLQNRALAFDEQIYKEPSSFSPERFLPERGEPDPTNITFGYGRRYLRFPFEPSKYGSIYIASSQDLPWSILGGNAAMARRRVHTHRIRNTACERCRRQRSSAED